MSAQHSLALASKSKDDRKWFSGIHDDVDSDGDDDGLTEQRLEQWRPFSQNPFIVPHCGLAPDVHYQGLTKSDGAEEKAFLQPQMSRVNINPSQQQLVPILSNIAHSGPTWINLFYDLAWTATFSCLTQNGKLDGLWDTVSYIAFFVIVWWIWASQTLYSIHFYTNDWFHLLSIFAQLITFGLLSATTRGYDVSVYIKHSPGIDSIDPKTIDQIVEPERYQAERVAEYSLKVIAFSLALSRALLWAQHLRVFGYAWHTARKQNLRIPRKLYVLPIGLFASNVLFWAAMRTTFSSEATTPSKAKLKFVFWGAGLIVEILLHMLMESLEWQDTQFEYESGLVDSRYVSQDTLSAPVPPREPSPSPTAAATPINRFLPVPQSNVNLRERLEGITTVILGEGLNGIAGTLYSVLSAPTLGDAVDVNVACAAILVYFLAYFYFEGPTGHRDPKGSKLRQMVWMLLHFPFMLAIILLLLGVKNQFLMTSFLSTKTEGFEKLSAIMPEDELSMDPNSTDYLKLKNFLLKRGLVWESEFNALISSLTSNGTIPLEEVDEEKLVEGYAVWFYQIILKIVVQLYKTFMGGSEKINPKVQAEIDNYFSNGTFVIADLSQESDNPSYASETILTKLLTAHLLGARYITGLAAIILISLGVMNRVHSKPRDRFQWGIIISRMAMGSALLLLLLLNVGRYQTLWVWEEQKKHQAGVFQWILAYWVLPTLAVAFVVEFLIESILLRCSGLAIARKRGRVSGSLWRLFFTKPLSWSSRAK